MNDAKNVNPGPETQIMGRDVGFMNECNTVCLKLRFFFRILSIEVVFSTEDDKVKKVIDYHQH